MASSEASESNYLDVLLKGEQIIQAVMRKSIDSEKSSTPSKRRYGLRSRAETILEATQAVLHDFSNKSDSIQDEHLNAAVKCLQLMAGAQKAGLTSFTPKFVSEFLEDQTEKVVAVLEKLDENRVLKFGLQFWTAHLQVVLTMTKHLTPEILVRACHPVAEWIKQFAFDAKTEVYKETVRLSEQIKNSDLEEDCKTATLGALEVSDMVPLNVSKRFPSPSKILAPTNFSALFKSPAQQSQSSSQPVRTTRRSSVKRPVALVDEDSVDYVPITSKNTGSARKKAKLTEHQKEKFAEKKDKLPFMDEDSQSCQNLIGVLATNFDFESSSQSASTQGQKKEEGNPGQETREKKEKNDNENGNQEIGKVVEPESAIEDNKRKTNVKLDFERESPAIADEPNLDKESDDGEEEIQKMDVDVNDVVPVTSEVAEKSGPTPTLEERLVETSLKDPETPEEENEAENTPQKFATPEKEVVTPTHSPSAAHLASKRKSRTPTRHQARPKWAIMDSVAKVKHDKKKAEIAQVLPPPVPARLTPVESPKAEKSEEKEESEKIKTEENVENAEIPEQDQDQENQSQALETKTPPRIVIEPVKPTVGTPSILKKPGTPMNSEKKKYRVHFHSPDKADVSTSDEVQGQSQETSVSTPMTLQNDENQMEIQHLDKDLESGGKKAEEDEEPIFSELIDCDQPVTSVIPRLIPHGHSSTSQVMLRKTLASQGVKTVGDLAKMRPRQITKLNIKKPRMETAKTVLKEYFEEKEKERKLAQERILEMEKRRKEEEEAEALRLTQERENQENLENQDKQGETELGNGNEKENEQADDSIVPDSNESSKDKASFIEDNCEDDDELEMSQVLGVPEEIPDEECENRRVVLPVVCKMPEIPSERSEYSRMNDQDHEQERIVILDDEVDEYDSDKENQKAGDDDGEKDDKFVRSIHNTPQSTNCDGRGGQTVSPQFSPIKKLHGILTELTDETGDNLDEEFNIQKEPLKLDHSVGQKVLEAQKDECEVPEVMNKSFDEDMTVDELEEMPQKEAEAKNNDIDQAIRALHSLPDACGRILNTLQSLTEEQMGCLKGTLSDAILPFNELIAKVALSK